MTQTTQLMTAEELLQLPDNGLRYELIQGEIRSMSPAGHSHGRIAMNISTPLDQYVRVHGLGAVYAAETGFQLATDPDTVRAPDVAFIRRERVEEVGDRQGYWPGAPDLAVEMISPNDTYTEVEEKIFDWLGAGTRLIIVANPRRRVVTVYRSLTDVVVLTEHDTLAGSDVVPGWTMPVADVFA